MGSLKDEDFTSPESAFAVLEEMVLRKCWYKQKCNECKPKQCSGMRALIILKAEVYNLKKVNNELNLVNAKLSKASKEESHESKK